MEGLTNDFCILGEDELSLMLKSCQKEQEVMPNTYTIVYSLLLIILSYTLSKLLRWE